MDISSYYSFSSYMQNRAYIEQNATWIANELWLAINSHLVYDSHEVAVGGLYVDTASVYNKYASQNAGVNFYIVSMYSKLRYGDMVVFNNTNGGTGRTGFVNDYANDSNNRQILTMGSRAGEVSTRTSGRNTYTLISASEFIGGFRFKQWNNTDPDDPNPPNPPDPPDPPIKPVVMRRNPWLVLNRAKKRRLLY